MVELDELVEQIISWAGNLAAGTARWFELIARFDRLEGFARWECVSTAQWLNWQCGLDLRAAREHVRVARCLGDLPLIRERFCRGELSYSKVRAITRVATPASEADLVMLATHGTAAHVERIVAALRRLSGPADPDQVEQIYQRRALHWYHHEDGSFELRVRVPPEDGVVLRAAIEQALTAQPEPRRLHAQRAADALVEIASGYLDGVAERGTRPRCDVSVHVEATVLAAESEPEGDGESGASGRCHLEDGPPIAAETARRLTCDAIVIDPPVAKVDAADVNAGVGTRVRRTRTIPQALRRQMHSRDGGNCQFPGCHHRYTQRHHLQHWARGGPTIAENLLTLCPFHHRRVHEGGWGIQRQPDGTHAFSDPAGPTIRPPDPPSGSAEHLHTCLRDHVTPNGMLSKWAGERLDLDHISMVFASYAQPTADSTGSQARAG